MANRDLKIQGTKVGLDVNEVSIYRGSIGPTNLLSVLSKKQFVTDGYNFTDDDQYGTYVCQGDSPCYSTLTLNLPSITTTTTTAAPTTTTTTSAATTTTSTSTTTTTAAPPTTTTTTSAPGPTTTTTTTACQVGCTAYDCSFHGQGWFNVSYDGATQTATISAYFNDHTIMSGGTQTGISPNQGTVRRNVPFKVDNAYFTNSGTTITCAANIDTSYTTTTTTSTTSTTTSTTTTTTSAPNTTTTTTAAPGYEWEFYSDGGDTVTFTYTDYSTGSLRNVVVPMGDSSGNVCTRNATAVSISMSPSSGTRIYRGTCSY